MASMAILLLAFLCLVMALNVYTAYSILRGMIAIANAAVRKIRNRKSSSSSSGINYKVFLSFRGPDTRDGFTNHLYNKLNNARIMVFKDDEKLHAGGNITTELKNAIKRSRISIVIFSKNYASSKYCLKELEQMWECRKLNGQTIIPIFYDISPSVVRHQTDDFAIAFREHEIAGVKPDDIKTWKTVLTQIGQLSGYDRTNKNQGDESQLVAKVLKRVRQVLKDEKVVTDKLVGIDLHVQEMMRKLGIVYSDGEAIEVRENDVRVVKICGMLGVGKTTLAKVVYNKIHMLFDECSFLENVNSEGVLSSQKRLIADLQKEECSSLNSLDEGTKEIESLFSNLQVLIVVDEVHEDKQIKALVGKLTCFGPGSRIIVTTSKKNVLKGVDFGAPKEYKVEPMRDHHALQLFRKHAFEGEAPQHVSEYDSLSKDIVKAIGGLPSAIVDTASKLYRENIQKWRSTLKSLEKHSEDEFDDAFKVSYESLVVHTREIFLDIACFFNGRDERIPSYMWEACGYDPHRRIEQLRDMHLLEVGENSELRMHKLLRGFGRKRGESKRVHQRCSSGNHSDALSFLEDGQGTGVEGIHLTVEEGCSVCFTYEELHKVSNLRYLRLDRANIQGNEADIQENTKKLLPNLKWLDWRGCCSISELDHMDLKKLVILDLSWSSFTNDSHVWRQIMKKMKKLKVLNLQGCFQSCRTLNFPAPISLEILILEDCTLLSEIGPFIRNLKKLRSLNLRNCRLVKQLPQELCCMESLRELLIDGTGIERIHFQEGSLKDLHILSARDCKELKDISTIGRLENLTSLALDGANIDWDPETFEFPQNLRRLSLRNCWMFSELPTSIGKLKLLEVMDLSYTGITKLPTSVKRLENLKTLKMAHTCLREFPEHIVKLKNLEEIDFSFCRNLGGKVPFDISGLSSLRILRLSSTEVAGLPKNICHLSTLQTLDILRCNQLHALPKLPSSLLGLRWGSKKMRFSDLSYLTNLKELLLTDGEQPRAGLLGFFFNLMTPNIGWITRLPSLETLQLSLSKVTNLPRNFTALTQLRELSLSYMKKLDLTQISPTSSLSTLCLKHCKIQKTKFSSLKHLSELELDHCDLAKIDGLEDLSLLEVLKISHCRSLTNLFGLKRIARLWKVQVLSSPRAVLPELSECVEVAVCK